MTDVQASFEEDLAFQEEELRPEESGDEEEDEKEKKKQMLDAIVLDEEQVRRDKEAQEALTAASRVHIKAQEGVMSRIHAKLVENGDFDAIEAGSGARSSARSPRALMSGTAPSGLASNWGSISDLEGSGSLEQRENARSVAEKMLRKQDRAEAFKMRSRLAHDDRRRTQEQQAIQLKASDARSIQLQKEIMEEQKHKAFKAHQKRSEQQKVFRENQREQERVLEAYYAKQHPAPSSPSRSPRPSTSKSCSSLPQAAASPGADTTTPPRRTRTAPSSDLKLLEEDIFRDTMKSHEVYAGTIERWSSFVKENEKRTDAHRRKVFIGSGINPVERQDSGKMIGKFRSTVTKMNLMKKFTQRASAAADPGYEAEMMQELRALEVATAEEAIANSSKADYLPSISKWETRREQCNRFFEEKDRKDQEKMRAKAENVQEHRQRIDSHNSERSGKALEANKQWAERNDVSAQRRQKRDFRTDADVVKKHQEQSRRRNDQQQRDRENRTGQADAKMHMIREVQGKARNILLDNAQSGRQKISEKDSVTDQNFSATLECWAEKADNPAYVEAAALKLERKKANEEEFRQKAVKEVEMKSLRSTGNLSKLSNSGLQRQRTMKREKSATMSHTTSTLAGQMVFPDTPSMPRNLSDDEAFQGNCGSTNVSSMVDALGGMAADSDASPRPMGQSSELGGTLPRRGLGTRVATDDALGFGDDWPPAPMSATQLPVGIGVLAQQRRGSMPGSDSDSDHEGAFLQDLETRSVKWLHEMRRQKENTIWKP